MIVLNTKNSDKIPVEGRKSDLSIDDVFEQGGMIDNYLQGNYEKRESQIGLARMVADSLEYGKNLIAEAPCGTGKSFAYLVPAIMQTMNTEKKIVVATSGIFLQEQLVEKDLPFLQGVFGCGFDYTLIKGRNNFLCNMKHEEFMELPEKFMSTFNETDREMAEALANWAELTNTGDKSEFKQEPSSAVWNTFSVVDEDCLHKACPFYDDCYTQKSREKAKHCNIIVCNYHILLLDLKLKAAGKPGFLPVYESIIFDEAHRLEEIARSFFGQDVSEHSCRRVTAALEEISNYRARLTKEVKELQKKAFLGTFESGETIASVKEELFNVDAAIDRASDCVKLKKEIDKLNEDMFKGIKSYYLTNKKTYTRTKSPDIVAYQELTEAIKNSVKLLKDHCHFLVGRKTAMKESEKFARRAEEALQLAEKIESIISQKDPALVYWIESQYMKPTKIYSKPVDISKPLDDLIWSKYATSILVSGTIAVGGPLNAAEKNQVTGGNSQPLVNRFSFNMRQLGLNSARTDMYICDSPFDFMKNCALVIPKDWPKPTYAEEEQYRKRFLHEAQQAIMHSGGRALILFTSYAHMDSFFENCHLIKQHFNVLSQKNSNINRKSLVEIFKDDPTSVLLGTASFWEGLDVPGEALQLLIIDKMPFPNTKQDPFLDAIQDAMDEAGGDFFNQEYVPRAIIRLKQGFGRLIRTKDDKGMVMFADSRCFPAIGNHNANSGYAQLVYNSFPRMRMSGDTNIVKAFFDSIK